MKFRWMIILACCLLFAGCGGSAEQSATGGDQTATGSAAEDVVLLAEKVKIKAADDTVLWSLKPAEGGAKLLEADERELARYRVNDSGKIKIKGPKDDELGAVEGVPGKWRIVTPGDEKLFILQRQDDGDWKLEDAGEQLLVRIQRRDYGWKLETPDGTVLGKVKLKGDKCSLRDPEEQTRWQTKDPLAPIAMAVMACERVPVELRAALALRVAGDGS